jgi:hypothetical protein
MSPRLYHLSRAASLQECGSHGVADTGVGHRRGRVDVPTEQDGERRTSGAFQSEALSPTAPRRPFAIWRDWAPARRASGTLPARLPGRRLARHRRGPAEHVPTWPHDHPSRWSPSPLHHRPEEARASASTAVNGGPRRHQARIRHGNRSRLARICRFGPGATNTRTPYRLTPTPHLRDSFLQ